MAEAIKRLIELDEQESIKQTERVAYLLLTEAVIEALPDALVVVDAAGTIVLFNHKAELMFGYHRSEMIGQPVERLMPDRARATHVRDREVYTMFDLSKRTQTMGIGANLAAIRKDGHEFLVDITLAHMVVRKGIHNLASIRFSQKIAGLSAVVRTGQQRSADQPADSDNPDA